MGVLPRVTLTVWREFPPPVSHLRCDTTSPAGGRGVPDDALTEPKPHLAFAPGVELEITAVDGHLELAVPSRVRVEEGPHGVRFGADASERLSAEQVRALMERGRR